MKTAFKQKLKAEAALAGKSINAEKEFHKILRTLAEVWHKGNNNDGNRMRKAYNLALTVIYEEQDIVEEDREKLVNEYSDLLNGDIDNYINRVACSIIYASKHGISRAR